MLTAGLSRDCSDSRDSYVICGLGFLVPVRYLPFSDGRPVVPGHIASTIRVMSAGVGIHRLASSQRRRRNFAEASAISLGKSSRSSSSAVSQASMALTARDLCTPPSSSKCRIEPDSTRMSVGLEGQYDLYDTKGLVGHIRYPVIASCEAIHNADGNWSNRAVIKKCEVANYHSCHLGTAGRRSIQKLAGNVGMLPC